ncbi:DsbA family protein [Paenibacillus larvae]|uniref:DsbA family protein n=1 Tax=Paenibacillus larvae TaxID=1464 RepID=UPI002853DF59|nr:thioredoxin domain-containing protein [Paenibacillus larvae]MDR5601268.1 thioredoxin domain-containing protein [Paenibacillus larvae]
MSKSTNKSKLKEQKKQEKIRQQTRQARMRKVMWLTAFALIVIVFIAALAWPKSTKEASFNYENLPVLGDPNVPVKIVEFGDFKCPACMYFNQDVKPKIQKDFIDQGKVAFYFINYTIIGPDSETAAIAAQSVFHQNKDEYWKYFESIYKNQQDENKTWATPEFLVELAKKEGIQVDYDKLKQDIENKTYVNEVKEQYNVAQNNKVNSTPTIFINGKQSKDLFKYEVVKKEIEDALQGK